LNIPSEYRFFGKLQPIGSEFKKIFWMIFAKALLN